MRISRKLPRRTSTGFFLLIKLYHYAESANHFDSMPEEFAPGYEFAVRTGKVFSLWVKTSIRPLIDHQRILFRNSIGLKLTPTFEIFRFVSILSRED